MKLELTRNKTKGTTITEYDLYDFTDHNIDELVDLLKDQKGMFCIHVCGTSVNFESKEEIRRLENALVV